MHRRLTLLIPLLCLLINGGLMAAMEKKTEATGKATATTERAILAGGCFWCMEHPFEKLPAVRSVTSGYTAGSEENPTYQQVSAGGTGHTEAVEIIFDPAKTSYQQLLEVFWRQIDPTDAGGQFVDRGSQYRSGIYFLDTAQQQSAEESKQRLTESGRFSSPLVTEIVAAGTFYPAEEYHQDYYKNNPLRYQYYRYGSGRDRYLDKVWGEDRGK